jgi:hypothetical protein
VIGGAGAVRRRLSPTLHGPVVVQAAGALDGIALALFWLLSQRLGYSKGGANLTSWRGTGDLLPLTVFGTMEMASGDLLTMIILWVILLLPTGFRSPAN